MTPSNTRAQSSAQRDAVQNLVEFQQPFAIDLQARRLRQRFALSPEVARTVACLAFAAEVRA